jgi:FdhD protein
VIRLPIVRHDGTTARAASDVVTMEEPLEIRVVTEERGRRVPRSVAVTMRTPGEDLELAAGFLFSEGVVARGSDIWRITHCEDDSEASGNRVDVVLQPALRVDFERLSRNVITSSACGVCGRASIEAVRRVCSARPIGSYRLAPSLLVRAAEVLSGEQPVFSRTGGIHAAALFDRQGTLRRLHEDVGRHNALDKLVGALLRADELPASDCFVLVSGRASFELVQKALVAGIPALAAVGAPSSLAVELAQDYGMTLVGFLRGGRFNVYAGAERIAKG